ncbi:hypothetical protein GH714_018660 [Hevea brasiliensis]|uniref:RING-type E3 ubiquitin transferase n=1 Tax=Hevea brasiliensis TaxID=3981 RepID=A0A6A6LKH9_HEVBR|nr:hypothetical protein GH714_018660 [Hevea brasiliensis]
MSSHEQALASLVFQLALSFDGAILGLALAYAAVRSFLKFTSNSKALHKIRKAPALRVSDLRSVLDHPQPSDESLNQNLDQDQNHKLVIVRGQVEAKSTVDGNWKSLRSNALVAHESGDKAVIIQRTQTEVQLKVVRLEMQTFIGLGLLDHAQIVVQWAASLLVYHQLQPIDASPYTFLQALFGHEYPGRRSMLLAFAILEWVLEIKSCKNLPYFLSDMTKDEMVVDLAFETKVLLWSGIVLGSISIGILGYAVVRNWNSWKEWRQQRQSQQQNHADINGNIPQIDADEEIGDLPDGQLCVICLMRRRRSAFIPCGHLVCCQLCAISVEREVSPKCPLCRQAIRNSMRIFEC